MTVRVTLVRLHGNGRIKEISPPLGIATLAGFLRAELSHQVAVSLVDLLPLEIGNVDAARRIAETAPDVVGLSYLTVQADDARDVIGLLRASLPGVLITTGWSHSTALPSTVLEDGSHAVIQGEGEQALLSVVRDIVASRPLSSCPGVWVKGVSSPPRSAASLLPSERIAAPAWDLLRLDAGYNETAHFDDVPALPIMASRGCAFDCSFCGSKDVWLRKVRFRPVSHVIDEMLCAVRDFGYDRFHFYDDDFMISREYARSLCEAILSAGLQVRWVCLVTVWALLRNREILPLMRRAGCSGIEFGFESADVAVLRTVGKRQTPEEVVETIRLIRATGFEYMDPLSMVFNEGETPASQRSELALFDCAGFERQRVAVHQFATPYPGTAFGERASRIGEVYTSTWSDYRSDRVNFVPRTFLAAPAPCIGSNSDWPDFVRKAVDWTAAVEMGPEDAVSLATSYADSADGRCSVRELSRNLSEANGRDLTRSIALLALLAVRYDYGGISAI